MTSEIALPRIHPLTGKYDNKFYGILNNQNLLHDVLLLHIVPVPAKCAAVMCIDDYFDVTCYYVNDR